MMLQCPNSEHVSDVNLVCFDECCKTDRLYCIQCMRNGIHISHPQHQYELPFYLNIFQELKKNVRIQLFNQINKWIWLNNNSIYLLEEQDLTSDLKLYFNQQHLIKYNSKSIISELNYYQISNSDINKSKDLYQKGYKLNIQDSNSIILTLNQYHEAIIWADKALQVDPKHCNSLYCKGDSL